MTRTKPSHTDVIVGFDVGTTATKAVAFDPATGSALAEAAWNYPLQRPRPGHVEQDPADWLRGIAHCAATLARAVARAGARPIAVGVTSQVNTHVFVDESLSPLLPAISWQDVRCADIAAELTSAAGDAMSIDASSALGRAEWVRRNRQDVWAETRWLLSPKDFCIAKLTGAVWSDPISSIGLVTTDGTYRDEALALVAGLADRVPPLGEFDSPAGSTTGTTGVWAGLPVSVGTMDAWCCVYGAGAFAPRRCAQMSGTSEVLTLVADHQGGAPGVVSFPAVRGHYLHAAPTQAGGAALGWIADLLGVGIERALASAAEAAPGALVFLPHLAGERAPVWNPDASAVFVGLTSSTTQGEMVRAVLEGVAHAARHAREACEKAAGFTATSLRLSGGGSRSELWNQIKADTHGLPLEPVTSPHTGCVGAALMAGVAAGWADDLEDWAAKIVAVGDTIEPDPVAGERLDALHDVYRSTYVALLDQFSALRDVELRRSRVR